MGRSQMTRRMGRMPDRRRGRTGRVNKSQLNEQMEQSPNAQFSVFNAT
jgi:hypothetical protein